MPRGRGGRAGPGTVSAPWHVDDLGAGTYVFRWHPGFYASAFHVSTDGVLAIDPVDDRAAAAYRAAVASVTPAPVTHVVYSHDHRDHACGARVLAPDAEVLAHPRAAERIAARGRDDQRAPTRLVTGGVLALGGTEVAFRHHGPSHSDSLLAVYLPTAAGRLLVACDVVEPEVAPYRELPDTDLRGTLAALTAMAAEAAAGEVDRVLGGHCGPDDPWWIGAYRDYFANLLAVTEAVWARSGGQVPAAGEDGVAMTERVRRDTCLAVAERLRPRYGSWRGFDAWAPRNADRVLSYLITGV